VDLLGAPAWTAWILPALLVVVWSVAWRRGTRRFRWWFVTLAPIGAVAGFVVSVLTGPALTQSAGEIDVLCGGAVCGPAGSGAIAAEVLGANLLWSIPVGAALFVLTLIVETTSTVRRSEAAQREATHQQ
jgi:hypothetical protein